MTSVGAVPVCLQSVGEEGEYGLWYFFELKTDLRGSEQVPTAPITKGHLYFPLVDQCKSSPKLYQVWWPCISLWVTLIGLLLPAHLSSQIAAAVTSSLTDQTSVISSLGYWPWEEEAVKLLLNFLDTVLDFTETRVKPTSSINTSWKRNRCFRGFF